MNENDRFYFIDRDFGMPYRYVFDKSDKSVELVSFEELNKSGVVVNKYYDGKLDLISLDSSLWLKIKTMYQHDVEFDSSLKKYLCNYCVGGKEFSLMLHILASGHCASVIVKCENGILNALESAKKLYSNKYLFHIQSFYISVVIPDLMIPYLLALYSNHDFNGIMRSFSNLLGSHIGELIKIAGSNVKLINWV